MNKGSFYIEMRTILLRLNKNFQKIPGLIKQNNATHQTIKF